MDLFATLGFRWDRDSFPRQIPSGTVHRALVRFRQQLPEFVWDAGVLEGNPITVPEVKTLLDGITVGGRKVSDEEQILNLAKSSRELLARVKNQTFRLDKATFCAFHEMVARDEALEWGHFRGEGVETSTPFVALGTRGRYEPLPTEKGASRLTTVFHDGVQALRDEVVEPMEQAAAFFLFGALQRFFFDGNKRTSRLMMNGILMSAGMDAISIPAARAEEFNARMVEFYISRDATDMMGFVVDCHPEIMQIRQMNPGVLQVGEPAAIPYWRIE